MKDMAAERDLIIKLMKWYNVPAWYELNRFWSAGKPYPDPIDPNEQLNPKFRARIIKANDDLKIGNERKIDNEQPTEI